MIIKSIIIVATWRAGYVLYRALVLVDLDSLRFLFKRLSQYIANGDFSKKLEFLA